MKNQRTVDSHTSGAKNVYIYTLTDREKTNRMKAPTERSQCNVVGVGKGYRKRSRTKVLFVMCMHTHAMCPICFILGKQTFDCIASRNLLHMCFTWY